jgi:MFS transporter, DHA1 family, tetracycline resistance protein
VRKLMLGDQLFTINKNTKLTLALQPLFSVPYFLYNSFSSLYMAQLGLSPTEIGFINSMSFISRTVIAVFAGSIINYLGRKTAIILFDTLSWIVPMLLWALASNFWYFFFAGMINSVVVVNGLCSDFYIVEDNDDRTRIISFNLMNSINIMAGLLVPIAGILISKFTLIPTMRGLYLFGLVCMCVMIAVKSVFLTDTNTGKRLKGKTGGMKAIFASLYRDSAYLFRKPRLMAIMAVQMLVNFGMVIMGIFFFLYLTAFMGMTEKDISIIPFISSFTTIIFLLFIIPRAKNVNRLLKPGLFIFAISIVLLILPVPGHLLGGMPLTFCLVILYTILSAAATALFSPVIQTVIASEIDDDVRANVMGVGTMISMLVTFPAGIIGGFLYEINPIWMFLFLIIVYGAAFLLYISRCR